MLPIRSTLAAALLIGSAALAGPVPAGPAAQTFTLGTLKLVALRDMVNAVPNDGSVFGKNVDPAAVAKVLRAAGADTGTLPLGVDALLVEMPGRVVLIDTGLGPKVGGALQRSLAQAGIAPDRVTDVLVTHTHGDHVGGLLTASGAPAFPRATVRMSAAEWAWARAKPENATLVRAIGAHVRTFVPGAVVVPGIRAVPLAGHTPGHVGYAITSGKDTLTDIGDTAHSAIVSLAEPGWIIGYDTDPVAGRDRREATLATLAASHARVFAPHFPFPGIGRIAKSGNAYVWKPEA